MKKKRFAVYCWIVLGYTTLVILWGALVRATGSGAGCGSHWPTCNGEVLPRSPEIESLIEYVHRATSGLLGILVLIMVRMAFRRFGPGHPVRRGAVVSLFFILTEATIGAGIVKFEWVADNDSIERVVTVGFHLANTFFLLAAMALTAWWAQGRPLPRLQGAGRTVWMSGLALAGLMAVGAGGAVVALGDTLVMESGIRPEDSAVVAALVELRLVHPLMAGLSGALLALATWACLRRSPTPTVRTFSVWMWTTYGVQMLAGAVNVYLQAPVWLQLTHLLLADALWILLILMAAAALGSEEWSQEDAGGRLEARKAAGPAASEEPAADFVP